MTEEYIFYEGLVQYKLPHAGGVNLDGTVLYTKTRSQMKRKDASSNLDGPGIFQDMGKNSSGMCRPPSLI